MLLHIAPVLMLMELSMKHLTQQTLILIRAQMNNKNDNIAEIPVMIILLNKLF
jgi:hypothetical protein